jgi:RHS repeat-associated protein
VVLQETYREKTKMPQETRSVKTYVYSLDLISVYTDDLEHGTTAQDYYFSDGLGSTVTLARDSVSGETGAWTYDAFGEVRSKSGTLSTDFLFTGEQFHAKARPAGGLYYLRARYYDPSIGRFLTQDPLSGIVGLPLSQNRYPYVLNDPINLVDPSGLCAFGIPCPEPIKNAGESIKDAADTVRDATVGAGQWVGEDYHWATVGAAAGAIAFTAGVAIVCPFCAPPVAHGLTAGLLGGGLMAGGLGVGTYLSVIAVAHSGKECAAGDTGACVSAAVGGVSAPLGLLPAPEAVQFGFALLPVATDVMIWAVNSKE